MIPDRAGGFKSPRRKRPEQETQTSLRDQRPERSTGSFDPVGVHVSLRSRTQYSLRTGGQSVVQSARAGVPFAGRGRPGTTKMHDKRRSAARNSGESIKNQSHVHPVHPDKIGVDTEKRHTATRFLDCVQASTPKCNVHTELRGKTRALRVSRYKGYVDWGGRLDAGVRFASPSCGSLCPPHSPKGGRGGRVSGEVTL
jgi:hypothetical protein